jgi:hypothetical protein
MTPSTLTFPSSLPIGSADQHPYLTPNTTQQPHTPLKEHRVVDGVDNVRVGRLAVCILGQVFQRALHRLVLAPVLDIFVVDKAHRQQPRRARLWARRIESNQSAMTCAQTANRKHASA